MLIGSICLSDIPREVMKKVMCKDGKAKIFVNIAVCERKEAVTFGGRTYTHFISCAPKKEERKEGVNYFIADLQTYNPQPSMPTAQQIEEAPAVQDDEDLPF